MIGSSNGESKVLQVDRRELSLRTLPIATKRRAWLRE
jgi:hypothetical protein